MYGFALTTPAQNEESNQLATYRELEETKDVALTAVKDFLAAQSVDGEAATDITDAIEEWLADDVTESRLDQYYRCGAEFHENGSHLFTARIELV